MLFFVRCIFSIWATTWQNQQNDLYAQLRLRSAWASAQSDQSLLRAPWAAKDPRFCSCRQRRLWSDWADAQADLSLCWAQKSFCWFYHAVAQLFNCELNLETVSDVWILIALKNWLTFKYRVFYVEGNAKLVIMTFISVKNMFSSNEKSDLKVIRQHHISKQAYFAEKKISIWAASWQN